MMMGIGLALATLGAILRYAIDASSDSFDLDVVGLILMIVGGVAFVTGVSLEFAKRPRQAPMLPTHGMPPTQPLPPQQPPPQAQQPPQSTPPPTR